MNQNIQQHSMTTSLQLPDGRSIMLNKQQQEALALIRVWLSDREDFFFVLSGYAGTGKTTIVKSVLDEMSKHTAIVVTAPTHKAKKVIIDTTRRTGATIQALLGLQPNVDLDDFDILSPVFAVRKKPEIEDYNLVVIDEASMLNADLFTMLIREATVHKTKLLFMCDEAQLPPVKEEISEVIISDKIKYRYQLTKVERQQHDNPLMKVYDTIRNNLNSTFDLYPKVTSLLPDTREGIQFYDTLSSFGSTVVGSFASESFKEDANHCRVLCWTNERVRFWNQAIRKSLMAHVGDTTSGVLREGELLMGYQNYTRGITNSADYLVSEVVPDVKVIKYGQRGALSVEVRGFQVTLTDVDTEEEVNTFIVEHEPENLVAFMTAFDYFIDQAKFNRQWPAYYGFKAKALLMQDIYLNGRMVLKKDLDYSYALTIHKCQGSTYNQVFIDMPDVDKNRKSAERNKLKYVALSRPSVRANILAA